MKTSPVRGFTLVEMLVVLAIMAVMTAVAVLGQNQFNNSILLTDTAYTVALSVRQAQSLGISSRVFSTVTNTGYGVHFANGVSGSYFVFADTYPAKPGNGLGTPALCPGHTVPVTAPDSKPGNCEYDSGTGQDGSVQTYAFSRGYTIGRVCGHVNSTTVKCIYNDGTGTSDFTSIDISFLRPNTQTVVIGTAAGNSNPVSMTDACIHIRAPNVVNTRGNIYISQVGEIAVLDSCGAGFP